MNFKDKLSRYHKKLDSEKEITPRQQDVSFEKKVPEHWYQLAELTGGEIHKARDGFYFYRMKKFVFSPEAYLEHLIEDDFAIKALPLVAPDLEGFLLRFKDFIYFDLETSGISGGVGTIAFLIGAAHVDDSGIVVHQWILPDFSFEHLILEKFHLMIQKFQGIVSYNGKTFDVPVMRNRYRLNRLEAEIDDKIHLDLLHPARRIWGKRLGSCTLQNLEKEILKEYRVEDLPAELIPGVFFNFLYGEGLEQFKIILEHNFLDLVNLVRLSLIMEDILRSPHVGLSHPQDFYQFLSYLYKRKKYKMVYQLMEQYISVDPIYPEIQKLKAKTAKKLGLWNKASMIYEKILFEYKDWNQENVIEYVKILEHKEQNYERALEILEKAKNHYQILSELKNENMSFIQKEIEKRQLRIQNKMKKKK